MTAQPITVKVTRYKCPCCGRTAANRARAAKHIGNCWLNPEAKGCKTCKHFDFDYSEPDVGYVGAGDVCRVDIDLSGRPACGTCIDGRIHNDLEFTTAVCPDCGGAHAEVKPGPIVHCDKWEATP